MGAPDLRSEGLKGARFGQHEIVRLIGHGATASVFEAKHVALGKAVALKLLHAHLSADPQIAGRFVREGQIAAKLRHPNAIDVIDVGVENGAPYLVMELLEGADLRRLLADTRTLDVAHALAFLLPIASALAHAHDNGILHRDVKPANIFLARDVRDDVVPKLVDFGLSKATSAGDALTATEMVAGTVLYMAPEQTIGVRHASAASDQYSLAAVLYECLTGEPPFNADGVYALVERIRGEHPQAPSGRNAQVPAAIDPILLRAMSHEPAQRYPDMRAFARDLLPLADEGTARALDRDFTEPAARANASSRPRMLRSSGRMPRASPEAETRVTPAGDSSLRTTVGPLPCAPGESPFHIKGNPYRGLVALVTKAIPGGMDAFCDALVDDRLRAFVRQPFLASVRYDVLPFVPLYAAIARILATPLETVIRTTTCAQARYDAANVYKRIFAETKPADIIDRIGRFNAQYYDFGAFSGTVHDKGRASIVAEGIPAYLEPWFRTMHATYTEESLRIAGAQEAAIVTQSTEAAGARDGYPLVRMRTELRWR